METLLVITNCPDEETANAIALALVEAKLAACVNILPRVQSLYRWQGVVESATEIPLFIKTSAERYAALETAIRELHPHAIPEIIALPVSHGLPAYLNWVAAETVQ
ncbi:divalent-cation tolerance protein CutA [Dechloromonas denitrificans]|jgi:periplasmic divalent cation tolerance protein|uniref:divalent-cation tolerance protein CutA n=1 Tax=Dechloromonas denitrificans TaxID=281362 RepID=UPI001CF90D38|nr:divalent-cation tolerance protein CutA [Dechloromonas denitrificans]UCV03665.1 divalent-cation tolerance protein CutA [Dechloromonas denitrificans]UCV07925.1 divalent-cation tolerance protein CutA [Dechloromonas denitrificans]